VSLVSAIDTGLRACALSIYDDGTLVAAMLIPNPERTVRGPRAWDAMRDAVLDAYPLGADTLVVEIMQHDGRTGGGASSDVFELVGVGSRLLAGFAGRVGGAVAVTPSEWSTVPKQIRHARLAEALGPDELELLAGQDHNVWDSAALGYWYCVRHKQRVQRSLVHSYSTEAA
jgi:hypothetical protein